MMMQHQQAMSRRDTPDTRDPNPDCTAELIDPNRYFADDVPWVAYTCPACLVCIRTVNGGAHHWNSIVDPSPSRADRIAALGIAAEPIPFYPHWRDRTLDRIEALIAEDDAAGRI